MVKKFTGQVKAQDIRDIFSSFTTEINSIIDDYNSSIDTIDEVISNAKKYPPKFQYNETNRDILGNYISEVEVATGNFLKVCL